MLGQCPRLGHTVYGSLFTLAGKTLRVHPAKTLRVYRSDPQDLHRSQSLPSILDPRSGSATISHAHSSHALFSHPLLTPSLLTPSLQWYTHILLSLEGGEILFYPPILFQVGDACEVDHRWWPAHTNEGVRGCSWHGFLEHVGVDESCTDIFIQLYKYLFESRND